MTPEPTSIAEIVEEIDAHLLPHHPAPGHALDRIGKHWPALRAVLLAPVTALSTAGAGADYERKTDATRLEWMLDGTSEEYRLAIDGLLSDLTRCEAALAARDARVRELEEALAGMEGDADTLQARLNYYESVMCYSPPRPWQLPTGELTGAIEPERVAVVIAERDLRDQENAALRARVGELADLLWEATENPNAESWKARTASLFKPAAESESRE